MMTKRVERAVIALAAALLVALFGFSPKSVWAAGKDVAQIGDTTYETVQAAIDSVEPGSPATIELLADVTDAEQMMFVKPQVNITVDLAGFTYAASAEEAVHIDAADVTLTLKNGTITNNAEGDYSDGLYAFAKSNNLNLTLDGVTLSSRTQTLAVQGMTSNSNVTIRNSALSSEEELGIYYPPKSGTLTIEGSSITGTTGIVLKGSTLVVKDGSMIHGTGKNKVPDGYYTGTIGGDGFNDTGDALYVESGYNDRPIVVDIQGGNFKSNQALAVRFYQKEGEQTDHERTVEISGGTFSSRVDAFLVEGVTQDEHGVVVELPDVATVNGVGYQSFEEAVAAAQDGQTVTLLADTSTDPLTIDKGITLDLGGHTLSLTGKEKQDDAALTFTSGTSTIKNGTIVDTCQIARTFAVVITGQGTALTMEDATLTVQVPKSGDGYGMRVLDGAELTLNAGAVVNSAPVSGNTGYIYGINVYGNGHGAAFDEATASKLTVNEGATVEAYAFAVSGNGDGTKDNTLITINGGTLVSEAGPAIYHPQYGKLVINGGTLDGCSGVEIRAGELTVNGGTIKGDTSKTIVYRKDQIGGSNSVDGGGIIVAQHSTKLPVKVTVNGGTIEANTAFIQHNVMGNDQASIDKIEMSITGGEFVGALRSDNFKDADDKGFVSGGSFSDRAVGDYLAPDAAVAVNGGETPYDIFPSTDEALENGGAHTVVDRQGNTWVFADKDAASSFAGENGSTVKTVTHTVTFDDCLPTTANTVVKVENGTTVARPAEPVCAGWTFEGWYADASLTTPYDFSAPVTGDITLYAKWSKDAPSISGEEEPQPPADETLTSTGDMVPLVTAVIAAAGARCAAA
ncbi:InlB B-repeat-containing protein [uncultured Enorma sp.]|uniref:InlB B-repeat-containing protein n=1 Tax=uncultured Enorma sp. TaxID=1714346 RepID=UPI0025D1C036|nr:InlB B-repeat-containing protein [uncultured Enorma sp.]